jgi:hypothetical protein
MNSRFIFVFILFSFSAKSQDFIILKKRNTTLQTFFTGSNINFQLNNREWIQGYIKRISHDSLVIQPIEIRYLPTIWGTRIPDTLFLSLLKIPAADINAMPRKNESFEYIKNGTLFRDAGFGYLLLNIINALINNESVFGGNNITKQSIAISGFVLGKVLQKTYSSTLHIGKKYHLQYINLTDFSKTSAHK